MQWFRSLFHGTFSSTLANLLSAGLIFLMPTAATWGLLTMQQAWPYVMVAAMVSLAAGLTIINQLDDYRRKTKSGKDLTDEEIETTIRDWLFQAGYSVRSGEIAPNTYFAFHITDLQDRTLTVLRFKKHPQSVTLVANMPIEPILKERFLKLDDKSRRKILLNLRLEILKIGINYRHLEEPLDKVFFEYSFPYESMTPFLFSHQITFVIRAVGVFAHILEISLEHPD